MRCLMVGQMLYGYCGGYFGRDSYGDKRVEAVGVDWVVVREDGLPKLAYGARVHEMLFQYTVEPTSNEEGDDYDANS